MRDRGAKKTTGHHNYMTETQRKEIIEVLQQLEGIKRILHRFLKETEKK